jgi:hypothetical protein
MPSPPSFNAERTLADLELRVNKVIQQGTTCLFQSKRSMSVECYDVFRVHLMALKQACQREQSEFRRWCKAHTEKDTTLCLLPWDQVSRAAETALRNLAKCVEQLCKEIALYRQN